MKNINTILLIALPFLTMAQIDSSRILSREDLQFETSAQEVEFLKSLPIDKWPNTSYNRSDSKDRRQGFWLDYYDNGNLELATYYRNDTVIGSYYSFYENEALNTEVYMGNLYLTWAKGFCKTGELFGYEEFEQKNTDDGYTTITSYSVKYFDCENDVAIKPPLEIGKRKYK